MKLTKTLYIPLLIQGNKACVNCTPVSRGNDFDLEVDGFEGLDDFLS